MNDLHKIYTLYQLYNNFYLGGYKRNLSKSGCIKCIKSINKIKTIRISYIFSFNNYQKNSIKTIRIMRIVILLNNAPEKCWLLLFYGQCQPDATIILLAFLGRLSNKYNLEKQNE